MLAAVAVVPAAHGTVNIAYDNTEHYTQNFYPQNPTATVSGID